MRSSSELDTFPKIQTNWRMQSKLCLLEENNKYSHGQQVVTLSLLLLSSYTGNLTRLVNIEQDKQNISLLLSIEGGEPQGRFQHTNKSKTLYN